MFSILKNKSSTDSEVCTKSSADFPLSMEQQLEYAQPAESARTAGVTPYSAGADYDYLRSMKIRVDGLWLCCCGAENQLVHWTGPYPFKYLECEKCEHILCGDCETTQILTPWTKDSRTILGDSGPRLTQVCPSCGLSHRAVIANDTCKWVPSKRCHCGQLTDATWLRYTMKNPGEYPSNPKRVTRSLKNRRQNKQSDPSLKVDQRLQEHDSAQNAAARRVNSEPPAPVDENPESSWGLHGLRRRHGLAGSRNSIQPTPKPFPTRTRAQSAVSPFERRLASLASDINRTSLKRAGALRGKHGDWNLAVSADYIKLRQQVNMYLKATLGEAKYREVKGTAEGEQLVRDVFQEQFLESTSPIEQYVSYRAHDAVDWGMDHVRPAPDLPLHAPRPIRRAVTYDQLLHGMAPRPTPIRELSSPSSLAVRDDVAVEGGSSVLADKATQDQNDWAETYNLYQKSTRKTP
ncbi:hypothetical protein OPT61_g1765 [Boeremia exigua]|uniref:Uncharacterized protein n=1 Tax=Boeremia exigua TaxID=749465 RepID=A0ACC2INX0_9PLEO|nr:hypothetical protein OPT61_g1765 [Boeremia exigua]